MPKLGVPRARPACWNIRSRPSTLAAYSPTGAGGVASSAPPEMTGTRGSTLPEERNTVRVVGKRSATMAGRRVFMAQVVSSAPVLPNLRAARKMRLGASGRAARAARSIRSALSVSMPQDCMRSRRPGSLQRATAITRRAGSARLAARQRVGPILPAAPSTRMSPGAAARSSRSASSGRESRSSRAVSSAIMGRACHASRHHARAARARAATVSTTGKGRAGPAAMPSGISVQPSTTAWAPWACRRAAISARGA